MASSRMIPFNDGQDLNRVISIAVQDLQMQGYDVNSIRMGATSAKITVRKDRDGVKNILGLGIETAANIIVGNGVMNVNFVDEWTNKIAALAVGWFLCLVPFITGIVGAVNQSKLDDLITTALTMGVSSDPYAANRNPYQQRNFMYQQDGFQQPQQTQYPQQPQVNQNNNQ